MCKDQKYFEKSSIQNFMLIFSIFFNCLSSEMVIGLLYSVEWFREGFSRGSFIILFGLIHIILPFSRPSYLLKFASLFKVTFEPQEVLYVSKLWSFYSMWLILVIYTSICCLGNKVMSMELFFNRNKQEDL